MSRITLGSVLMAFSVIVLTVIAISLALGRHSAKDSIIGTWQLGGSDQTLVFAKENSVIASSRMEKTGGYYEFVDNNVIELSWHIPRFGIQPGVNSQIYLVRVSGNTLTLMGSTSTLVYYRVK